MRGIIPDGEPQFNFSIDFLFLLPIRQLWCLMSYLFKWANFYEFCDVIKGLLVYVSFIELVSLRYIKNIQWSILRKYVENRKKVTGDDKVRTKTKQVCILLTESFPNVNLASRETSFAIQLANLSIDLGGGILILFPVLTEAVTKSLIIFDSKHFNSLI